MSEYAELILSDAEERMEKAIAHSRTEFSSIRSGRATPTLVEKLSVEAYGVEMKLQEMASIAVPEARQLLITPHDPSNLENVERAIRQSDLGLSPSNDGRSLRLNFPPLTEERRKELVRMVKKMAEDGRISIRNIRRGLDHGLAVVLPPSYHLVHGVTCGVLRFDRDPGMHPEYPAPVQRARGIDLNDCFPIFRRVGRDAGRVVRGRAPIAVEANLAARQGDQGSHEQQGEHGQQDAQHFHIRAIYPKCGLTWT